MQLRRLEDVETIVVHHSASPRATTTTTMIRGWHAERDFEDIGYHFVIEGNGDIVHGRPLQFDGAHCKGHNANTIGICLVGNNTVEGEEWAPVQIEALFTLCRALGTLTTPHVSIVGHRQLGQTECPGDGQMSYLLAALQRFVRSNA